LRYGVVLDAEGDVDEAATLALRAKITAERGPLLMFERGGTMPEIMARAKAETGFDAPSPPRAPAWLQPPAIKMAAE